MFVEGSLTTIDCWSVYMEKSAISFAVKIAFTTLCYVKSGSAATLGYPIRVKMTIYFSIDTRHFSSKISDKLFSENSNNPDKYKVKSRKRD